MKGANTNIGGMKFRILLLLFSFYSLSAFSQVGILDSTFGVNGISSLLPQGGGYNLVIGANDKIYIGANIHPQYYLVQFDANGNLLGTSGYSNFDGEDPYKGKITMQPDGKIVMGDMATSYYSSMGSGNADFFICRFLADGEVDYSFNGNGRVVVDIMSAGFNDTPTSIAVQPNGKIIEAGWSWVDPFHTGFSVIRVTPNGALDHTFSWDGKATFQIYGNNSHANKVLVQPDGKILLGGFAYSPNIPTSFALIRLNLNGSVDTSFGILGCDTAFFGSVSSIYDSDGCDAMALQGDGKILMGGSFYRSSTGISGTAVLRYNADGTIDTSFGESGKIKFPYPDYPRNLPHDMLIQPDGKILLAGDNGNHWAICRLNSNGSLDSTFNGNGFLIPDLQNNNSLAWADGIAIQSDGKIVVSGYANEKGIVVLRILSGLDLGVVDLSVSDNQLLISPNLIKSQATLQYILTKDENISVTLYDMQGKLVQTFITNEPRNKGKHEEVLHLNELLPSGSYIISISNGKNSQGVKVVKE